MLFWKPFGRLAMRLDSSNDIDQAPRQRVADVGRAPGAFGAGGRYWNGMKVH